MRWAEHVEQVYIGFWWENRRERRHLQDLDVDGKTILNRIVRKQMGLCTGFIWLGTGTVVLSDSEVVVTRTQN